METPVTVLILAAGLGTRMKSKQAKVLHPVGGRRMIEHVIRTALQLVPPKRVIVVIGHQAEQIEKAVAPYGTRFVTQDKPLGTGHAVRIGTGAIQAQEGLLVVLYGDAPLLQVATLRGLIDQQAASEAAATVVTAILGDPTGYGRILTDAQGRLRAIVEEKAASPGERKLKEINSGVYCFQLPLLRRHLAEIRPDNPAGEYYLTDIVELLRRAGHWVGIYRLADATEILGINTRAELAAVDRILRNRKARELMLAGVTIESPETVTIDPDVSIGPDTVVESSARILGRTRIGTGCRIGAGAILRDARLGDGVEIGPLTLVNDSELEAGVRVGPYARLRFANHIEAGAAVGNFVELKKTRLGRGAKALHLAYLGDATIGGGVNIGAGTITCNYDGITKHQTTIREGAFIGSNSTLVAPLEIGAGSYVGAGSVITKKVPGDALAVGRARQVVRENWARRRREARTKNK